MGSDVCQKISWRDPAPVEAWVWAGILEKIPRLPKGCSARIDSCLSTQMPWEHTTRCSLRTLHRTTLRSGWTNAKLKRRFGGLLLCVVLNGDDLCAGLFTGDKLLPILLKRTIGPAGHICLERNEFGIAAFSKSVADWSTRIKKTC